MNEVYVKLSPGIKGLPTSLRRLTVEINFKKVGKPCDDFKFTH